MLERFRIGWRSAMNPPARFLLRLGLSADAVTWIGAVSAVLVAVVLIPLGWLWQAAVILGVLVLSDSIDGQMARLSGTASHYGAFLDACLDRVVDGAVIVGLLMYWSRIGAPFWWLGIAAWALVVGQVTSYVKARAEAEGFSASVGLAARADRLLVLLVGICLSGVGVTVAALVAVGWLALAGTVTVGQRLETVRRQSTRTATR